MDLGNFVLVFVFKVILFRVYDIFMFVKGIE